MTTVSIPKNFASKLAKAVLKAQENDEDVEEVIKTMIGDLKTVKGGKPKKQKSEAQKAMVKAIGKRPGSAYNMFCTENRPRIKEDNPDASFADLTRLCAAEWAEISDKEKAKLQKKVDAAKAVYEKKKKAYVAKHGDDAGSDAGSESDSEEKPKTKGKAAPKGKSNGKSAKKLSDDEEPEESEEKPKTKGKAPKGKAPVEEDSEDSEHEEPEEEQEDDVVDYNKKTLAELKALCKEKKVKFDAKAKKADLVKLLSGDAEASDDEE